MMLKSVILALAASSSVVARPSQPLKRQAITSSETGTSGGYYYSFWSDNIAVSYTNGDEGEYTVTWTSGNNDFVAGKGWETGSDRNITYTSTFNPDGNTYLSVYGWTTDPLHEYYIVESYTTNSPGLSGTLLGNVTSDGAVYNIYTAQRTNAASIEGTTDFEQFWSVRTSHRTEGTVTTANHFAAWKELGLEMGTMNYQVVAVQGIEGEGSATVTVT